MRRADILMVTHRSPAYVEKSLPRLLASLGEDDRVWLWHNGNDSETLQVVKRYQDDPRVAAVHHSEENVRVIPPTRWLWTHSAARYVGRVDDDCLVPDGWIDTLSAAFADNPQFGALATWHFPKEDFAPQVAQPKIAEFNGGHTVMRNLWVQGSGHLVAKHWIQQVGLLGESETFTQYCRRMAARGAVNGWYVPFLCLDHMDDPRSANTLLTSDDDLRQRMPLSAQRHGVDNLTDWTAQLRRSALMLQEASLDLADYEGVRAKVRNVRRRIRRLLGLKTTW